MSFSERASDLICIHPLLLRQAKVSRCVSLNRGPCGGMLQGLSHSDSYTWAMRRPGSSSSLNREGSFSSLSSQEMSLTNEIPEHSHTESQVCVHVHVHVHVRHHVCHGLARDGLIWVAGPSRCSEHNWCYWFYYLFLSFLL